MADKDVLSQEEIDALLENVDESEDAEKGKKSSGKSSNKGKNAKQDDSAEQEASDSDGEVTKLNFNNQTRMVKSQLPVLDKIFDRAKRLFSGNIYQLTGKDLEINQEAMLVIKHSEYMAELPNPSLMTVYRFKPLRGKGLITFDSTFVYDLVNFYFGGNAQFTSSKERTDFTATELKVMDSLTQKFVANLIKAWEPIIPLNLMKINEEINPQLVHISEPEEMLLVYKFTLDFGQETGSFSFAIPYSMVEPIKQQLELGATRPDDEIDPNWIMSLKEEIMEVGLTVSSVMAEASSSLGKVMEWKEGDFIPLEKKEMVTLDIEGTPSFTASLGNAGDKRALKIMNKISY